MILWLIKVKNSNLSTNSLEDNPLKTYKTKMDMRFCILKKNGFQIYHWNKKKNGLIIHPDCEIISIE